MNEAERVFSRFPDFIKEYIYNRGWSELRDIQLDAARVIFETDANLLLCSSTASGKTALAVLTTGIAAGIATAPVTGGISLGLTTALAAPIAVTTGVSIPAIILASFLGVGFIIALFKEYSVEIDIPNKKVIFTKN